MTADNIMGISITLGTAHDAPAIMPIMQHAFDPRFGEAWTDTQLAGALAMPGMTLLLASNNASGLVGFALSRTILDESELMMIAVHPGSQGNGVGSMLILSMADAVRKIGAKTVFLEVRDGNPAIHLYTRTGFTVLGRRSHYYHGNDGNSYDALTYRLML